VPNKQRNLEFEDKFLKRRRGREYCEKQTPKPFHNRVKTPITTKKKRVLIQLGKTLFTITKSKKSPFIPDKDQQKLKQQLEDPKISLTYNNRSNMSKPKTFAHVKLSKGRRVM